MSILITGASGFIASNLMDYFCEKGVQTVALSRKSNTIKPRPAQSIMACSDYAKSSSLQAMLPNTSVIIHCAGLAEDNGFSSDEDQQRYQSVNVDQTLSLAQLAAEAGVKRFIFLSSIKVNGQLTTAKPFCESDVVNPQGYYAESKYRAEQVLLELAKQTSLQIVIIRPVLVYGPGVNNNLLTLANLVKKGLPLPFAGIHNQRDFLAIDNLIDFVHLCSQPALSPQAANEVFILSDQQPVSLPELLTQLALAQGRKVRLFYFPSAVFRILLKVLGKIAIYDRLYGSLRVDSSKASRLLGWHPVIDMSDQLKKLFNA